jgi:stage V sporulation protein K
VVILAGYANEIDRFLQDANPGLRSRFPVRINFHDYTTPEMIQIFEKFLFEKGFHFGKGARQQAEKIIADRSRFPNFGNARGVRNLVDETLSRTDERLQRSNGSEDLMEVCSEDIPH